MDKGEWNSEIGIYNRMCEENWVWFALKWSEWKKVVEVETELSIVIWWKG